MKLSNRYIPYFILLSLFVLFAISSIQLLHSLSPFFEQPENLHRLSDVTWIVFFLFLPLYLRSYVLALSSLIFIIGLSIPLIDQNSSTGYLSYSFGLLGNVVLAAGILKIPSSTLLSKNISMIFSSWLVIFYIPTSLFISFSIGSQINRELYMDAIFWFYVRLFEFIDLFFYTLWFSLYYLIEKEH